MAVPLKYKTVAGPSSAEFRDRGSRFIAFAFPVQTVDEVKARVKSLKVEHPKAAHYCVACRVGHDGTQFRASDDGEPSGSAGRPMLGAIDATGLTNVLVVVVRYFGGTLLGVPGLIHAYSTTTEAALSNARVIEQWIEQRLEIECDYATISDVRHTIRTKEGRILQQDLQLFCIICAAIPLHLADECTRRLSELRGVRVKYMP